MLAFSSQSFNGRFLDSPFFLFSPSTKVYSKVEVSVLTPISDLAPVF